MPLSRTAREGDAPKPQGFSSRVRRPADRQFPSDAAGIGTAFGPFPLRHVLGVHTFGHAGVHGKVILNVRNSHLFAAGARRRCHPRFTPLLAFAQDELDETVVTATRTPVPLDAVGAPVIVITRNDIERSLASDVSELLQAHAGLEIARNGGPGQTTSLFTRGTESNHTVVLIDGVRINPGTIGGAALQNIAPESLERIEIVKGPRSSLYGTDAIGGVVQLFTRGAAKDGVERRRHLRQRRHAAGVRRRGVVSRRKVPFRSRRQLRRERRHARFRR